MQRREAERLRKLQAVTSALARPLTPGEVASVVLEESCSALQAAAGMVYVLPEGSDELRLAGSFGVPAAMMDDLGAVSRGAPLPIATAARTGEPVWIGDFESLARAYPQASGASVPIARPQAIAALPLIAGGGVLGALTFLFADPRCFDQEDRDFLLTMAGQCAQAFYRAALLEAEASARRRVEALAVDHSRKLETIRTLVDALSDANRRKDEFLAVLGHELRNPLSPIVTALELMKLRGDTQGQKERAVIERQVRHLSRLVDDLLDLSRITRGVMELRKELLEIHAVASKAIEMASPLIEQRGHRLAVSVPREGMLVLADPVRFAQVISNLLTNAAKYTDTGGVIEITAEREGASARISVKDNGCGIGPELLPDLFQPFVQGRRTLGLAQGGLGIGLSLVRSLVTLHGGTVTARSAGAGMGSEFIVRVPLALDAEARGYAGGPKSEPFMRPARRRILVVEDDVDTAEGLSDALREMGYEVEVAGNGREALALADESPFDVAVLDIGLPEMDGYELARRLLAQPSLQPVRLVALTGYGHDDDRAKSRAAGFAVHLTKPVNLKALLSAIEAVGSARD